MTTDTAAALRGRELDAEILLKATRVDGVYSDDPEKNPHAVRYEKLTYNQVFRDNLRVMDMAAIDLCRERSLPILVFNYKREGSIERAIAGTMVGTLVTALVCSRIRQNSGWCETRRTRILTNSATTNAHNLNTW